MTVKKKRIITTGLTSELFLLTFLASDSAYNLAKRLQNKKNPEMSKIYPALKVLTISKYLKYNYDDNDKPKKVYYVNTKKLTEEITRVLKDKGKHLDKGQAELVEKLYDMIRRVEMLSGNVINKMHKQPKGTHRINALEEICSQIGFMSCMFFLREKSDTHFNKIMKKVRLTPRNKLLGVMPEIFGTFQNIGNMPLMKKEMEKEGEVLTDEDAEALKQFSNLMNQLSPMTYLLLLPRSFFKKLIVLYDKSDAFFEGSRIAIKNLKRSQRSKNDSS